MAYMNQDRKKAIADALKKNLKGINLKYSLSVRNHSTIVMTIKSGDVDFIGEIVPEMKHGFEMGYINVNPYWFRDHFEGRSKDVLTKIFEALNMGNHDRSDVQTDYFDVGWYVDVCVGKYNAPYILTK